MRRLLRAVSLSALLLTALALAASPPAEAADPNAPHPHQGVVKAYAGKPTRPDLTEADVAALAKGEAVLKQIQGDAGGRGIAVQDIKATPAQVWSRITAYDKYPAWVENVDACKEYGRSADHILVEFQISAMFVGVTYYVRHTYKPNEGYMTWTLDYSRLSDLDDSVGFWLVEAIPDKPGYTRVFYSVDVKLSGWVPSAVESMLAKSGLTKATAWVKRESEALSAP